MKSLMFNTNYANKDFLSAFKKSSEKNLSIHQGMSVKEISEVVSEKIIMVVKKQFEATKSQYETMKKNKGI